MTFRKPVKLRQGPFTVFVSVADGCLQPEALIRALPEETPVMWCDSARTHPVTGRWSLLGFDPWLSWTARGSRIECRTSNATVVSSGHPLEALRKLLKRYRIADCGQAHARAIGFMGYCSYELNRWIENLPKPKMEQTLPEMQYFGMRSLLLIDHIDQRSWLISIADPHRASRLAAQEAGCRMEEMMQLLDAPPLSAVPGFFSAGCLRATSSQQEFERMVSQALEHIKAGDIFQANIAQRFTAQWQGSAFLLYEALRRINPSPFAAYFSDGKALRIVSASPERLVRIQQGQVEARPIAGTRRRGQTPAEDALNSLELFVSEKERAEHIMLVDLARNDLGRVCQAGSVYADELLVQENYSHVMHIVSNITGHLRQGADCVDVLRAVFPGGTITGCPKVRCMELLSAIEPVGRGLYTGSMGFLGCDGSMDLNIAIRTMVLQEDCLTFYAGAGIVADSKPSLEYQETLAKAEALRSAIDSANAGEFVHAAS